jgi:hypothetical protein
MSVERLLHNQPQGCCEELLHQDWIGRAFLWTALTSQDPGTVSGTLRHV